VPERAPTDLDIVQAVFDGLEQAVLVCDEHGRRALANAAFERRFAERNGSGGSCCALLGCRRRNGPLADRCLTRAALQAGHRLPAVRIELPGGGAAWVDAAPLPGAPGRAMLSLRPADEAAVTRRDEPAPDARHLLVLALGPTEVHDENGPLGGDWLEQRPGRLLKLLVSERRRPLPAEAIAEALWPTTAFPAAGTVRYWVHALRDQVEPERPKRAPSAFVTGGARGYQLDPERVEVDADLFEEEVGVGLAAVDRGQTAEGVDRLERAADLYRGDFLAEERYATWVEAERVRLRRLLTEALRVVVDAHVREQRLEAATRPLERLAELEPYDLEIQRELVALCMRRHRHSEAHRRYTALRARMRRDFGEDVPFSLAELAVA
jgi:DNA-binding SARP family transcriptional activator